MILFRNVTPQLKSLQKVDKKLAATVLSDIEHVQWSSHNEETFKQVYSLLEKKYLEDDTIEESVKVLLGVFFNYFRDQWVDGPVFKFYEGANPWSVMNNQGLEGQNKDIKQSHTMKRKCPLGNFCDIVKR